MNHMDRADLHCHTYYSDGELSPQAAAEEAARIGLRALAITDHDTMEGLKELKGVPGLEIVPGIERKAYWEGVEIHVLGFDCDWEVLRQNPRVQQRPGVHPLTHIFDAIVLTRLITASTVPTIRIFFAVSNVFNCSSGVVARLILST